MNREEKRIADDQAIMADMKQEYELVVKPLIENDPSAATERLTKMRKYLEAGGRLKVRAYDGVICDLKLLAECLIDEKDPKTFKESLEVGFAQSTLPYVKG